MPRQFAAASGITMSSGMMSGIKPVPTTDDTLHSVASSAPKRSASAS